MLEEGPAITLFADGGPNLVKWCQKCTPYRMRLPWIMDSEVLEPFPILETSRLQLGPLRAAHTGALLELFGDEQVVRFHDVALMRTPTEALQYISEMLQRRERRVGIRWAILERAGQRFVGMVGLNCISTEGRRCTLGYELLRSCWGQGYATEAADAAVRFAHRRLGAHRVEAAVLPGNRASLRVLAKLGFTDEGLLRALGYWGGRFHDLRILSKLGTDYPEPATQQQCPDDQG